jgi:hypothetical protein
MGRPSAVRLEEIIMPRHRLLVSVLAVVFAAAASVPLLAQPKPDPHANEVPPPSSPPRVVAPGAQPGSAPADALVLFDGTDLSAWVSERDGSPAAWTVENGVMVVKPKAGGIRTKQAFGDVQLHIEWATPAEVKGQGQGRGNSGVFLMANTAAGGQGYEVQVLDSYENATYWHGMAGSVYKQHAPLVNASRKPGEWQVYDIVFRAPRFNADGKVVRRASFTVFHNGVLVQDNADVMGITTHQGPPYYKAHPDKLPISLQDHGDLVRFRNIWVRELEPKP